VQDLFLDHLKECRQDCLDLLKRAENAEALLQVQGRLQFIDQNLLDLENMSKKKPELKDGRSKTTGY
jgi:hypothetical protein